MKRDNMVKFRAHQLVVIVQLMCAFIISLFKKKDELWLITERGVDARDNGYWFFKYVKEHHPEINAKFIISKKSVDRDKLTLYNDDLVDFRSFKHYILLWRASHLISTHIQGYFPFAGLGLWLLQRCPFYGRKYHISLKHGITKDYISFLEYSNTHVDMLTAGAKPEYDFFISKYNYPENVVKLTGFCRFDQLGNYKTKKQILVMPTWREWLYVKSEFESSEFAKQYISLLTSSELHKHLEDNDLQLVFYPHHELQKYMDIVQRHSFGNRIVVATEDTHDVQTLLKESILLITDYSSVFFDFAYMRKPVIFFHFDYAKFRKNHYAEGWFDYSHSFGPVVKNQDELLTALKKYIENDFDMEAQYLSYAEECFPFKDDHNTERVFNSIVKLKSPQD